MQNTQIVPLGDRVVVEPIESQAATASGIIIPETVDKEKPMQGVVVAVGEGRIADSGNVLPMNVKIGDKVLFSKYAPDEVKIDDKDYYIISETSILAILA